MSTPIYKLMIPVLWAGMIFGLSAQALGVLTFTSVVDNLGRQWGDPFSVNPGTYNDQFTEVTTAGYTGASIADVAAMYLSEFGPNASDAYWPAYVTAFGFSGADARTTTATGIDSHSVTGYEFGFFKDLDSVLVVGSSSFSYNDAVSHITTSETTSYPIGFMFYKQVSEPTLTLLLGGSLMGLGYMAYRRKKALA